MNISTSGDNPAVESSFDELPECEWHTKDPITGELFYLSKGVLYSKFPQKESQKIISINPKENINLNKKDTNPKKHKSLYLTNSAKFSNVYKGNKIQIFGGNSIANSSSQNEGYPQENYAVVTNIVHAGIVVLEFICPITLTNLGFGMISEKDLKTNNISKQFKNFKTSSRRNLIMQINYWEKKVSFYLNDIKVSTLHFRDDENIPIVLIKKKSTCVILNPLVKYLFTTIDFFFQKEILFKLNKPEKLEKTDENNFNTYLNYFKKSFNKEFNLKYVFGDMNKEGEISNFICAKFDKKFGIDLKNNFDKICTNKNISLVDKNTLKQIKKNLTTSSHLSYSDEVAFLSKLKNKFTKEEKDKEKADNENKDYDEVFVDTVVKYIIENFDNIEINMKESFSELKKKFEFFKNDKNILDNLKPFFEKSVEEKEGYNSFIDYVKNDDCLLMINKNKLKIIKREENGLFDLTNFIDIKKDEIPHEKYIIFEKEDLIYFLQNFDVKGYINYFPSFSKIHCLFNFLNSITKAFTFGKNKIILSQKNSEFFYSSIISFLNFSAFITKRHKVLNKKLKSNDEKISEKEKEQSQKNLLKFSTNPPKI